MVRRRCSYWACPSPISQHAQPPSPLPSKLRLNMGVSVGNPYPYPRILHQENLYPYPYGYGRYITHIHGLSTRGYGLTRGYICTPWESCVPTCVMLPSTHAHIPLRPLRLVSAHSSSRRPHSPLNASQRHRRAVTAGRAGTHEVSPRLPTPTSCSPPLPPPNSGPRPSARARSSHGPPGSDWVVQSTPAPRSIPQRR